MIRAFLNWFKSLFTKKSGSDPIILSIRANDAQDEDSRYEPFVFEVDGKPYLRGTLSECMESRHAYAQRLDFHYLTPTPVLYKITDLPEPHQSNLDDFYTNPIPGRKP